MLFDKVIKGQDPEVLEKNGYTPQEGCCRFCGQIRAIFPMDGTKWNQDDLDECASEMCGCNSSFIYREKKAQKERAATLIRLKFGQDANNPDDPDSLIPEPCKVTAILGYLAEAAVDGIICKASVKITPTIKADIIMTASEKIKIEKTVTHKDSDEA